LYSLKDLSNFIQETDRELTKPLKDGDYDGLVNVMGILMRVKDRQQVTDEMFEPLKETIELLKVYNQEMPDEVHQQLQVFTTIYWYAQLQVCVHVAVLAGTCTS